MFVPHAASIGDGPRVALILHGILGSGTNFRGFARRLSDLHPDLRFVLVDLRAHGASQGPPPPHTVRAAAEDLLALERSLDVRASIAIGHSFGGKVALAFADMVGEPLDDLWILDTNPGSSRDRSEAGAVQELLESLPWPLPSRERFFELIGERGVSRPVAEWLAMNVRREGDGFVFRVDLAAVRALLDDYFAWDAWPLLARGPAKRTHVVLGGRSNALAPSDRERMEGLARSGAIELTVLPEAGHWVHVDDPEGLFRAIHETL